MTGLRWDSTADALDGTDITPVVATNSIASVSVDFI
jgi:hypothetical protein